jgi:ABC-type branched-subunit amino acid transport system substrate-binding protein
MTFGISRATFVATVLMALGASCTLTTTDTTSCTTEEECVGALGAGYVCGASGACELVGDGCTTNADCKEQNGFGSVCGAAGSCEAITVHPRCTKTHPEQLFTRDDRADYIVIGNLMDRSVGTHQARENSAELAVLQANAEGGLEGKKIGVVFCTIEENVDFDTLERTEAAVAAGQWLAEVAGVPAIVGPAASSDTGAVFDAVRDAGVLVISPSATSPALTTQDNTSPSDANPGLLWRTAPPDSIQGAVIAEDMLARGLTQIAVINQTGAYGDELVRVFEEELGLTLVELLVYDEPTQIADQVVTAGASGAEEVLFVSSQSSDVVAFLNAAASTSDFDAKTIFLSDSAANIDVLGEADTGILERVRGTRPTSASGPVFTAFQAAYAAEFNDDVTTFSFTAHAYDAAWLVLYGTAYATFTDGAVTGKGIAQGLRRISDPDGADIELRGSQWLTAVQSFRSGETINVSGASGALDYDAATEETTAPIEVWRVSDNCEGGLEVEAIPVGTEPAPKMCP